MYKLRRIDVHDKSKREVSFSPKTSIVAKILVSFFSEKELEYVCEVGESTPKSAFNMVFIISSGTRFFLSNVGAHLSQTRRLAPRNRSINSKVFQVVFSDFQKGFLHSVR